MSSRGRFFAAAWRSSVPLWVWAAHFAFCYVGVALGCHAGWHERAIGGWSLLHWLLGVGTGLAFAITAWLAWAGCRHPGTTHEDPLSSRVLALCSLLALVAIAWTAAPLLALPSCRVG